VKYRSGGIGNVAMVVVLAVCGAAAFAGGDDKDKEDFVVFDDSHPAGEVQPDKALIYVVRPTSMGFAVKSFFFCDDDLLGINRGSSYFFSQVAPGKHAFWSKSENIDALELQVEAGRTYYFQQHMRMGGFRARTEIEVLGEAEGKEALAKCKKHGTVTEQGRATGREYAAKYKTNVQEDIQRKAKEASPRKP
jgi:Protein of unknown function (DUF2846)